jgi:hypothetical protein
MQTDGIRTVVSKLLKTNYQLTGGPIAISSSSLKGTFGEFPICCVSTAPHNRAATAYGKPVNWEYAIRRNKPDTGEIVFTVSAAPS